MNRLPSARCAMLIAVLFCAVPTRAEQPDAPIPVPAPRPAAAVPETAVQPDTDVDAAATRNVVFKVPVPRWRSRSAARGDTLEKGARPTSVKPEVVLNGDAAQKAVFKVPLPRKRPATAAGGAVSRASVEPEELPAEEVACRDRLTSLGVRFTPADPIAGAGGCGISHPIRVTWLPQQVKLSGRAVMGCEVSESLARWTVKVAIPQARQQFGENLTVIEQYASYVCRSRNSQNGAKLSEHAKGNAIDLGRFHLANGTVIDVAAEAGDGTPEKRFLKALREEGCGYFKTVLGPGSDPYHNTHFHFDVAQRRNGSRYCR